MALRVLLAGLEKRAPWLGAGRLMLKHVGFTTHRGYKLTIEAALEEVRDETREQHLAKLMTEHAVAGEKLVQIVKLEQGERAGVLAWIRAKRKTANVLTEPFPSIAAESELRAFSLSEPTSLGSISLEDGSAAGYTAVRSYLDRIEIPVANLRAGLNDGFEHVYAVKRVFRQTIDAIWLPAGRDFVCLIADLPLGVPSGFARDSQDYLMAQLRRHLGRALVPINLWPAIDGLYKSAEGRLVDHGFVNNEDAVKSHTARRGGRSLRDDPYDRAGAQAVGEALLTYKVAVAWARPINGATKAQPEVILPGTAQMLSSRKLTHFIARNCISSRDLSAVTSRIIQHIDV